jgi:hypothetical protein
LEKENLANDHVFKLLQEAFGINNISNKPKIFSCIVSQNYSGSNFVDDKIAVFDEFLFKYTFSSHNYSLKEISLAIENDSYIPEMPDVSLRDYTEDYAGYKITYPRIAIKK